MAKFAFHRAFMALMVALTVSVATFFLLYWGTDPAAAIAGPNAPQQVIEQVRKQYGLDRPIAVQYADWITNVFTGNLGTSYLKKRPVVQLLAEAAPVTITLSLSALAVTILIAIPLGIVAAMHPNSLVDRIALSLAMASQAVPSFWLGLVMIVIFSVTLGWLPVSGDTTWWHFVLPAIVLGTGSVPAVMRLMRNGLLDVLSADYIRTARAKGLLKREVVIRHAMRNALLPVISILAVQLGRKLGGSVITESVFALNGLGRLALQSIIGADAPTLQILVFVFALVFVIFTFLSDILNAWLDPRIRLG
jgi:peptide/nickel transport system permease protein